MNRAAASTGLYQRPIVKLQNDLHVKAFGRVAENECCFLDANSDRAPWMMPKSRASMMPNCVATDLPTCDGQNSVQESPDLGDRTSPFTNGRKACPVNSSEPPTARGSTNRRHWSPGIHTARNPRRHRRHRICQRHTRHATSHIKLTRRYAERLAPLEDLAIKDIPGRRHPKSCLGRYVRCAPSPFSGGPAGLSDQHNHFGPLLGPHAGPNPLQAVSSRAWAGEYWR